MSASTISSSPRDVAPASSAGGAAATRAAAPAGARSGSAPAAVDPSLPPPLFTDLDTARVRESDPLQSHMAADLSQHGLKEAKLRVLQLVRELEPVAGTHLNRTYDSEWQRREWKRLSFDSPRKRAAELVEDGFLAIVEVSVSDGNHLPEKIYGLTDKGRQVAA